MVVDTFAAFVIYQSLSAGQAVSCAPNKQRAWLKNKLFEIGEDYNVIDMAAAGRAFILDDPGP